MNKKLKIIILVLFSISAIAAFGTPNGPSEYAIGISERGGFDTSPPISVDAQAGNVTELEINVTSITKNWQGYFGNVSGKITLDNADNWTMYDWAYASPQGRIYSSRINSVSWANIDCMRFEGDGSAYPNLTTEETGYLGANPNDGDGVDETFKYANHSAFTVGSVNIPADTCNSTFLYVTDSAQMSQFSEVLLTDNSSNNSVVYTTLIEQNTIGFNNRTMDFQMIVGENGHGNSAATQYYFWVELA